MQPLLVQEECPSSESEPGTEDLTFAAAAEEGEEDEGEAAAAVGRRLARKHLAKCSSPRAELVVSKCECALLQHPLLASYDALPVPGLAASCPCTLGIVLVPAVLAR